MPTPTRSRRSTKTTTTTAAKKPAAAKPKKPAAATATTTATKKKPAAPAKKAAPVVKLVKKPTLRMSENERCASVARTLQRALRRHPKLKGVRVVARGVRLSFFEIPEESVEPFAKILERMWSKIRRYVE
nr:hypothetical protein [Deltaproteobacteria bacterium]